MDARRFQDLKAKASTVGLNDAEAGELGRLYAEAVGEPYADAEQERVVRDHGISVPRERATRRRRWPFGIFGARRYPHARSLEIGQTATPAEDTERELEAASRR
jgi:hypothetical protein